MKHRGRKRKFLVDVFHTYAYSVCVEASDGEEAKRLVEEAEVAGRFDPASFRRTDDLDISCHGEVDNSGPNPWPELEVKNGTEHGKVHEGGRARTRAQAARPRAAHQDKGR